MKRIISWLPPVKWKLLALLLLPFAFFWRESLGWATLAGGDVGMYFYPLVSLAAQQLRAGQMPWWNPTAFAGLPLLANLQAGLFDPFVWPLLLSPTGGVLTFTQLLNFVLALLAAYACARSMGLLRRASAVTAVIYALNGFLVGRILYPGKHTVEFHYRSNAFLLGAIVSATTLLALVFMLIRSRAKAKTVSAART